MKLTIEYDGESGFIEEDYAARFHGIVGDTIARELRSIVKSVVYAHNNEIRSMLRRALTEASEETLKALVKEVARKYEEGI